MKLESAPEKKKSAEAKCMDERVKLLKERLKIISVDMDLLSEAINKQKHGCQLSNGEYLVGYQKVQRERSLLKEYFEIEDEILALEKDL